MVMTTLKETEALRGKVACPRSLSQEMTELALEPGSSELPIHLLGLMLLFMTFYESYLYLTTLFNFFNGVSTAKVK